MSRKIFVATTINGSTAKVISASFQFMHSMMARIPASTKRSSKIDTTPEVNISFNASTSVVTRVTSRPTGFLSKKRHVHALQMPEDLAAQIEHHLLPGPLHEVGLQEFKNEGEDQQPEIDARDLRDARAAAADPASSTNPSIAPVTGARYRSTATFTR